MIELKATTAQEILRNEKDYDYMDELFGSVKMPPTQVYLKSEADKEIEFWKKESHEHYERWFNLNKQFEGWFGKVMRCERAEREARHHKYKRCLAMARWCVQIMIFNSKYGTDKKWHLFKKWHKRWLALAEKFKEAK